MLAAAKRLLELPVDEVRIAVTLHLVLLQIRDEHVLCRQLSTRDRHVPLVRLKDEIVRVDFARERARFDQSRRNAKNQVGAFKIGHHLLAVLFKYVVDKIVRGRLAVRARDKQNLRAVDPLLPEVIDHLLVELHGPLPREVRAPRLVDDAYQEIDDLTEPKRDNEFH